MFSFLVETLIGWSPIILLLLLIMILFQRIMPSFIKMWLVKSVAVLMIGIYLVSFLHYTLPQRDIIRITDAYEKRENFENRGVSRYFYAASDSGSGTGTIRDVRYIDGVYPNGEVIVFRNEDTGIFGWPPYFKVNSSDVNAEAKNLKSDVENPKWVSIKHYGWRSTLLTIYPNVVSLTPVSGPSATYTPWFNIIFFIVLALVLLGLFRMFQSFKNKKINPMIKNAENAWDDIADSTSSFGAWIRGWFKRSD